MHFTVIWISSSRFACRCCSLREVLIAIMAICQECQQERQQTFACSRCRSARYCSKDCQRAAWPSHKQTCIAPAKSAVESEPATQMGVLLGEGFSAKSCRVPKAPLDVALVRHHFTKHKDSRDSDFLDMLMPVSDRLFERPMRIVYDSRPARRLQPNTFATRDACNLHTGFGPDIRGQVSIALVPASEKEGICKDVLDHSMTVTDIFAIFRPSPVQDL